MGESPIPEPIAALLQSGSSLKLARGVVGKSAYVAVAALVVMVVVAWRIAAVDLLWVLGAVVVVFAIWCGCAFPFAYRNPGAALLEGAELVAWAKLAATKTGMMAEGGPGLSDPSTVVLPGPPSDVSSPDVEPK